MSARLVIVDAHAHAFRAYYALDPMHAPDGLPTHALFGFAGLLRRLVVDEAPEYLAVVFDAPDDTRCTFRSSLYPPYKAHRPERPRELAAQIPYLRDITRAFGLPVLEHAGFEADDLIASIVARAEVAGLTTIVQSSDKDLMQLVSERTVMWDAMRGKRYTVDAVIEKFGVPPRRIADYLALVGDATDNVPGVPGVGPKTASALLTAWGSLDGIYEALETLPPRERARLEKYRAHAFLSRELTELRRDVPLEELGIEAGIAGFALGVPDVAALDRLGTRLGFRGALRVPRTMARSEAPRAAMLLLEQPAHLAEVPHPVFEVESEVESGVESVLVHAPPPPIQILATLDAVHRLVTELLATDAPIGLALLTAPDATATLGVAHRAARFEIPLRPAGPTQGSLFGPAGLLARDVLPLLEPLLSSGRELALEDTLAFGRAYLAARGARTPPRMFARVTHDASVARHLLEGPTPTDVSAGDAALAALTDRHAARQRLAAAGLERLYGEVELPLLPALVAMEAVGVSCDLGALDEATRARIREALGEVVALRPTYHLNVGRLGRLAVRLGPARTLPLAARPAFRAAPGRVLVHLELAQPELRGLAHLSGDAALIGDAQAGDDLHAQLAAAIDGGARAGRRDVAKRLHFALLYGVGPLKLARECALRASEMKALVVAHRDRHPTLCRWLETRVEETRRQGYAETLAGRRCPVPELFDDSPAQQRLGEALAMQVPVLGTAAELAKRFAIGMFASLSGTAGPPLDAALALQLGDSLFVDADPAAAPEVARRAAASVAALSDSLGLSAPLRVRAQWGAA